MPWRALHGGAGAVPALDVGPGHVRCCICWDVQGWDNIAGCGTASDTSIFPGGTRNLLLNREYNQHCRIEEACGLRMVT